MGKKQNTSKQVRDKKSIICQNTNCIVRIVAKIKSTCDLRGFQKKHDSFLQNALCKKMQEIS